MGLEVTTIIEGIRVNDHQGQIPVVDVVFINLDLNPSLFGKGLVLLQEDRLRHAVLVDPWATGGEPGQVQVGAEGHQQWIGQAWDGKSIRCDAVEAQRGESIAL